MQPGKVWTYIQETLRGGPMHMTLLDPASSPGPDAERIAAEAATLGTHGIMVGGSTGVTPENLDTLVTHVKDHTRLPVIYFPSSAGALSPHVDAIWFLSALNSRNPRILIREQARGAPIVRALRMETIGLGYVIVAPGMRVGTVSEADLVPRTEQGVEEALGYALAAQAFGMPAVYLEAGSGAPEPVPAHMVKAVKAELDIPLIVGGGIRTGEKARALLEAGADILVTGTIAEDRHYDRLRDVVDAVRHARQQPAPSW